MTTTPGPPQVVIQEAADADFGHPENIGGRALEALHDAGFAVVHMPNTEPELHHIQGTNLVRAKIGRATARVNKDTGRLRNVILDDVVLHDFDDAVALTQDLVAILHWAKTRSGATANAE